MDWVVALGAVSLGAVVGWLIRYFIRRIKRFTPQALTGVISAAVGGGALKLLTANEHAIWFYFFGLLLGFVVYHLVFVLERRHDESYVKYTEDEPPQDEPPHHTGKYSGDGALFGNKNIPGGTDKTL